jgi:DNA-binding response OmpR family regulator
MARVLIVEDDTDLLFLYATALSQGGYEAVQSETVGTAIAHLSNNEHFDGIILDLNLPDAHGSVVVDYLQQNQPQLVEKVMVITANDRWLDGIVSRGVKHMLVKPVSMATLLELLRNVVG